MIGLKPFGPKQLFDVRKVEAAIERALDDAAQTVKAELEKNTATWETDVNFEIRKFPGERVIGTDNLIYKFVTGGTRKHDIPVRNAPRLAFYRTGFKAKTSPRRLGSVAGRRAYANFVRPLVVTHPGTEARNFEAGVVKKWEKRLQKQIIKTISDRLKVR